MSDVAVCVSSCDNFFDVWSPALECLARFWPDRPSDWPLYTMSNRKAWGERPIVVGDDRGWNCNLRTALDQIKADFVLMFLDDMLLCRPVDTAACITASVALALRPNTGAIRLGQGAEEVEPVDRLPEWSRVTITSPYRISTSPTLWRTEYLRKILARCGPTAWEFETQGSAESRMMPEEIWVQSGAGDEHRAFRCYYTAITRGAWNRGCLNWLKQIGVEVGELTRGVIENVP